MDAVEKSTDIMMATFLDKIRKASSEESARRSYVTGMTDMLTVARKALGFWGAEQVRMELERWNAVREPEHGCGCGSGCAVGTGDREASERGQHTTGEVAHGVESENTPEKRTVRRDPMYA